MGEKRLGEFEHHVLLAILRSGSDAHSVGIVEQLERHQGRDVATAAVYIALRRLEKRGLLRSETVPAGTREGQSHDRRYFRLMPLALETLKESRRTFLSLWDGLGPALDE